MNFNRLNRFLPNVSTRLFSISSSRSLIQKWRRDRGLPLNPNAYGVLTDKSDYTYLDGRPTPLGVKARERLFKQREIAAKIIQLSSEVDFAVERHDRMKREEIEHRRRTIEMKLKPKGDALLSNK